MIDEKIMLKANILGGMNTFMTDYCGDKYVLEIWFKNGVPDGAC